MAVNPYTLNGLFQKGIIDYVDPELSMGAVASPMQGMVNPYANIKAETYLNNAMQGQMYHNHGNVSDSFTSTGSFNNAGQNIYNQTEIGSNSTVGSSMFGAQGIGSKSTLGIASSFGAPSIGAQYQGSFEQSMGGLSDVKNGVYSTTAKAENLYNSTPDWLKGILAVGIGIFAIKKCFSGMFSKSASKASTNVTQNTGSKWNPINWFKSKK
jgi:hypothetical protein